MAKFKTGQSGNPAGRKKGAINKVAKPIKEQLSEFLNEKIQELPEIWKKLSPRDKTQFLKDLMPYYMARLQAVEFSGDVNFHSLPEYQLDLIAEKLLTNTRKNEKK